MKMFRCLAVICSASLLASCSDDGPRDYMRIAGGGLTFNYRYSQATMVLVGKQIYPLPEGSSVQALFDIPGEAEPERVSRPRVEGKLSYKLESKYLTGIKKGVPLKAVLLVVDKDGREIDRDETTFTSDVDQDKLPSKPLMKPDVPNYIPQLENLN
jgi:hypothetical protein